MNCADLGKRLKQARIKKGLTQEVLAEKIDTAPSYISDIERGMKAPGLNTFVEIISVLDVSADAVLQGSIDSGKGYVYDEITKKLNKLTPKQRQFISEFIDNYIESLH